MKAISLADLMGMANEQERPHRHEHTPLPIHEAQIATLQELLENSQRPRFKAGDLVTPRQGGPYVGEGQPFLVIEVAETPHRTFGATYDGGTPNYGESLDVRVLGFHQHSGKVCAWWQESMWLEPYTAPRTDRN